jgi:hypothetical protein
MIRRRSRRPAAGQLWFLWFTAAAPIYLDEPRPPRRRPRPAGYKVPPSARRRVLADPRPPADPTARVVTRWIGRGAACCLCRRWPAAHDHMIGGRLLLLCRVCEDRPDSLARLGELVREDWRRTPEANPIGMERSTPTSKVFPS